MPSRPVLGLLFGLAVGLADLIALRAFGMVVRWGDADVTLPVMGVFAATFATLGYMNGRLSDAREQIAEQLKTIEESQAELIEKEQLAAIGRMAAGVAHEVRNPLGVIRSAAALLAESLPEDDEEGRTAGRFIEEEIGRLDRFVRSLLDFSRPIRVERRATALSELAKQIERLASVELSKAQAALDVELADDEATWSLDPDLVAQAISTLVVNACQAVEADGRVVVRLGASDGALALDVADDGPGVDEEVADTVFEPFVTTKAKGTGLGLAMAARIAEAHGGTLRLVPGGGVGDGGAGACFRFEVAT